MLYRLRERWNRHRFAHAAKGILQSPPLGQQSSDVVIVSSVSHLDLMMYLVAIKSFHRHLGRGQIVILNDGTLTRRDLRILKEHVSPVQTLMLDDVPYSGGQKGVRWGIMLAIADLVGDAYVIQLDSDTVTCGKIDEVLQCVQDNRSFTLGSAKHFGIVPISEICKMMKRDQSEHVQKVAERNFDRLPSYPHLKYVRGNSGLAGFGKGAVTRKAVEEFLKHMALSIGTKWRERGSYQVTSNYFVANAPEASVLPLQRYTNVTPSNPLSESVFLHFIGRYRFENSVYTTAAGHAVGVLTHKLSELHSSS